MKPRYDESPLINKAIELEQRINRIIKAQPDCPNCKDGKLNKQGSCMKMDCDDKMAKADMATKDKYCMKNFGKKYSECSEKQKGQCDKAHGKMTKGAEAMANPKPLPKEKITDINPQLFTESGGQTRTSYYTSNGKTIESEDGKPKRAKDSKKVDLGKLGGRMNPHAGTGVEREDSAGEGSSQ